MRKPDRIMLTNKIISMAGLSKGKGIEGYFSRSQLIELSLILEVQKDTIDKLKTAIERLNNVKNK